MEWRFYYRTVHFYCFLIIGHSNGFAYATLYTGGSFTVFV
jgi:hypothetical protein